VAGTQTLKARVRKDGGNSTPTARIDLYENGALVASGTDQNVISKNGQTITQTFNVGALPLNDDSGAGIEARFVGTRAGSGGTSATVDLGALRWTAHYITAPQTLNQFAYTLDAVGNPTQLTTPTSTTTYTYDNLNRLTNVCFQINCPNTADPSINWTYDGVGNRISETRPGGTVNYAFDADDEINNSSDGALYTYDNNGNLTDSKNGGTETVFAYDTANRLTHTGLPALGGCGSTCVSGPNNVSATDTFYVYDGDGNRRSTTEKSCGLTTCATLSTTNYLWDTNQTLPQLALERDGTGTTIRRYINAERTIAMATGTGTYYLHPDRLNSTRDVTASDGTHQSTYDYEPFGVTRSAINYTSTAPNVFLRFAGEYDDISTASSLYNLRTREYNTDTNTFLQRDTAEPATQDPDISSYVYAGDAPTVMVDPSGQTFQPATNSTRFITLSVSLGVCTTPNGPCTAEPIPVPGGGLIGGRSIPKRALIGAGLAASFIACVRTFGLAFCLPHQHDDEGDAPALLYRGGGTSPSDFKKHLGGPLSAWNDRNNPNLLARIAFEGRKSYGMVTKVLKALGVLIQATDPQSGVPDRGVSGHYDLRNWTVDDIKAAKAAWQALGRI
jgi:RHS repeat-associated protein